jgi:antitoxin component of RelBE/YafQ-DinJ toxin-antitoxin module
MKATLQQLVQVRSQLAESLMEYFRQVMEAPDLPETIPPYLGERTPTALYIAPDVLKWERKPEPTTTRPDADGRGRGAKDRDEQPKTQFAAEARDIGEETIYGEHERETERRVAWANERRQMGLKQNRCAVVLAPPGQGKSLLTQMTASELAKESYIVLDEQREDVQSVSLPVVVTLQSLIITQQKLAAKGKIMGKTPDEAWRLTLTTVLIEMGYPKLAVEYLVSHVHQQRCWLFLDALDEAGDDEVLGNLFKALKDWQCCVLITSRPYGYRMKLPFDLVTEYRLAPLTTAQARQFIDKWFAGNDRQAMMNHLLSRSPSVQQVSQNPFLLTLLCWVAERHELSEDIARTQIYDRVTRDLLGLPLDGTGDVDDQRAIEWLPLMREIAFTYFRETAGRHPVSTERLLRVMENSNKRPLPLRSDGVRLDPEKTANLNPGQQAVLLLDELRKKRLLIPLTSTRSVYVAPHRSFIEYFAACMLADEVVSNDAGKSGTFFNDQSVWEFIDDKASYPHWQEVSLFLAGSLMNPLLLLKLLANPERDDRFRHRLCLAALCLPELSVGYNEELESLIGRNAQEVFTLWWEDKKHGIEFHHLRRTLPAIGQRGGLTVMPELLAGLRDAHWNVRLEAAEALVQLGVTTDEVVAVLLAGLRDAHWKVRFEAAKALVRLGATTDEMVAVLLAGLHDEDSDVRLGAAYVLGQTGARTTEEVVAGLLAALRDEDVYVRLQAAEALVQMGATTDEVVAVLLAALRDAHLYVSELEDEDVYVRLAAAGALGKMMEEGVRIYDKPDDILDVKLYKVEGVQTITMMYKPGQ